MMHVGHTEATINACKVQSEKKKFHNFVNNYRFKNI